MADSLGVEHLSVLFDVQSGKLNVIETQSSREPAHKQISDRRYDPAPKAGGVEFFLATNVWLCEPSLTGHQSQHYEAI